MYILIGIFCPLCANMFYLNQCLVFIHTRELPGVCVSVCLCWVRICLCVGMCLCVSEGDVAWRSLLSDPMYRPMLWREGHCQETTTRQRRYSCPQCSFSSVAHTHSTHWRGHTAKHIQASCKLTHGGGKPPQGESPRIVQSLQNKRCRLLVDCLFAGD